jgi:hypothetical protein
VINYQVDKIERRKGNKDTHKLFNDEKWTSRSSLGSVRLALIDFFLLGSSMIVLHTHGSSFGREAANLNMRPVIDLLYDSNANDVNIFYSHDFSLVECGLGEFQRLRDDLFPEKYCYVEEGNREMCSRIVHMKKCNIYPYFMGNIWGLQDLYCAWPNAISSSSRNIDSSKVFHDDEIAKCRLEVHGDELKNTERLSVIAESNGYTID